MPEGTAVDKYGERACQQCGKMIQLRIQRDIERKRFCSKECGGKYRYHNGCFGEKPSNKEMARRRRKQAASLAATLARIGNPNRGRSLSEETKAKVSASQKKRLRENPSKILRGERHPNWRGGRTETSGYQLILVAGRYRLEHRYVMEKHLGRSLSRYEVVHHKNGNRKDNRIENLEVMDWRQHARMHAIERWTHGVWANHAFE